ncbi:hypothetical protein SODG_005161 [Sodalis praecaptivus]
MILGSGGECLADALVDRYRPVALAGGHRKARDVTVLLAIAAFSLCLLGTFLVRSGVLISVHAFASDPARGMVILAFLVLVIGGSLLLYAIKGGRFAAARKTMCFHARPSCWAIIFC